MALFADIVGMGGVGCFILAYFLLQKERVSHKNAVYLLLNLCGAVLIMLSLLVHWNLSAFVLEAIWALISIYGIYTHIYLPKRKK
jgi:hypothetical protein